MLLVTNLANTKWSKKAPKNDCNPGTWVLIWVLSESFPMNTNMTGFRWLSKNLCVIVLWTKTALAWCKIGSKTLLADRSKLPLKFTCPVSTSTCPATLLNKDELHYEDSAQNKPCWAGQVRVLFCLPDCRFLPYSLTTCNGASSYFARCLALEG